MAEWQPPFLALNSVEVKTCNPHIEEVSVDTALLKRGVVIGCDL